MKLPKFALVHKNHLLLLLLASTCSLLFVLIFLLIIPQTRRLLPQIVPITETPAVRLLLISPPADSTVSGTVPLVVTLSGGPKIESAKLYVDGDRIQSVTSKKTEKLTLFWDSAKHAGGNRTLLIEVIDDKSMLLSLSTILNVQNKVAREEK